MAKVQFVVASIAPPKLSVNTKVLLYFKAQIEFLKVKIFGRWFLPVKYVMIFCSLLLKRLKIQIWMEVRGVGVEKMEQKASSVFSSQSQSSVGSTKIDPFSIPDVRRPQLIILKLLIMKAKEKSK